jgi:hypothetical protein
MSNSFVSSYSIFDSLFISHINCDLIDYISFYLNQIKKEIYITTKITFKKQDANLFDLIVLAKENKLISAKNYFTNFNNKKIIYPEYTSLKFDDNIDQTIIVLLKSLNLNKSKYVLNDLDYIEESYYKKVLTQIELLSENLYEKENINKIEKLNSENNKIKSDQENTMNKNKTQDINNIHFKNNYSNNNCSNEIQLENKNENQQNVEILPKNTNILIPDKYLKEWEEIIQKAKKFSTKNNIPYPTKEKEEKMCEYFISQKNRKMIFNPKEILEQGFEIRII